MERVFRRFADFRRAAVIFKHSLLLFSTTKWGTRCFRYDSDTRDCLSGRGILPPHTHTHIHVAVVRSLPHFGPRRFQACRTPWWTWPSLGSSRVLYDETWSHVRLPTYPQRYLFSRKGHDVQVSRRLGQNQEKSASWRLTSASSSHPRPRCTFRTIPRPSF